VASKFEPDIEAEITEEERRIFEENVSVGDVFGGLRVAKSIIAAVQLRIDAKRAAAAFGSALDEGLNANTFTGFIDESDDTDDPFKSRLFRRRYSFPPGRRDPRVRQ
jgi:hypothetical protein